MRYARLLAVGTVLAALVFLSSDGVQSQDKEKKDPPKVKGQVPQGWSKIGLSAAQKESIYKIQAKYKDDIKKLKDQIADLESKERKELIGVLSDEQKKMLAEGLETSKDKEKPKEKPKEKDKN